MDGNDRFPSLDAYCHECINAKFLSTVQCIQAQLNHLAGYGQAEVERSAGHLDGPKCKWVNIQSEPGSDRCRSTTVSRAWAISACWLRTVLTAPKLSVQQSAKWRVLFHPIDTTTEDERLRPNWGLKQQMVEFVVWRRCITREALDHKVWVKTFYRTALKMQRLFENQAVRHAAEAHGRWLQEGPMQGLRRQHQMSRTAVGWISAKVCKPEANEFEPIDEVDGLSQEQLNSIKLSGEEEAPLNAQQVANDEQCKWGKG